jgi:hypothetical protein
MMLGLCATVVKLRSCPARCYFFEARPQNEGSLSCNVSANYIPGYDEYRPYSSQIETDQRTPSLGSRLSMLRSSIKLVGVSGEPIYRQ